MTNKPVDARLTATRVAESMSAEELGRWRSVRGTDADPTRKLGDTIDSEPDPTTVDKLLAWSGWRYMPGMRYWFGEIHDDAAAIYVSDRPDQIAALNRSTQRDCCPDLAHAGTLGCIGQLLCEAWGPGALIEIRSWGDGTAVIEIIVNNTVLNVLVETISRRPFADALVTACLAAPLRGSQ